MNEQQQTAIKKYDYEGSPISFSNGENVMVNATQMAEKFGKTPKDWLRTKQAKELIERLSAVRQISLSQLVQVYKGNSSQFEQGTWMHEDVALMFAQWLSPDFYIWCNDRIKELARDGVAVINDDDAVIAHAINVLQRRLDDKRIQLQMAQDTIEAQEQEIKTLAPMADYTRDVLQSDSTYTFTQVAKDMGFTSVHKFIEWAAKNNILYKQSGIWMPYSRFSGKGLFATRTAKFIREDGTQGSSMSTVVTEKGRAFLHNIINNKQTMKGTLA